MAPVTATRRRRGTSARRPSPRARATGRGGSPVGHDAERPLLHDVGELVGEQAPRDRRVEGTGFAGEEHLAPAGEGPRPQAPGFRRDLGTPAYGHVAHVDTVGGLEGGDDVRGTGSAGGSVDVDELGQGRQRPGDAPGPDGRWAARARPGPAPAAREDGRLGRLAPPSSPLVTPVSTVGVDIDDIGRPAQSPGGAGGWVSGAPSQGGARPTRRIRLAGRWRARRTRARRRRRGRRRHRHVAQEIGDVARWRLRLGPMSRGGPPSRAGPSPVRRRAYFSHPGCGRALRLAALADPVVGGPRQAGVGERRGGRAGARRRRDRGPTGTTG